jgi:hypothetical protein
LFAFEKEPYHVVLGARRGPVGLSAARVLYDDNGLHVIIPCEAKRGEEEVAASHLNETPPHPVLLLG